MLGWGFQRVLLMLCGMLFLAGCHTCGTQCEVNKVCGMECKSEKVEQKGWDVKCEQICIPPIHGPCSDPCEVKCGKVIAVKKLKADKLDCGERCVIKYKTVDGCNGDCGPNCQSCQTCQSESSCAATEIEMTDRK